jgi:hypothetical protein
VTPLAGQSVPTAAAEQSDSVLEGILRQPEHPRWQEQAPAQYHAEFETSRGRFVIEVQRDWSPHGADRFRDDRTEPARDAGLQQYGGSCAHDAQQAGVMVRRSVMVSQPRAENLLRRGRSAYCIRSNCPGYNDTRLFSGLGDPLPVQ